MLEVLKRAGMVPRACAWELTLGCNLRCRHCGSAAGPRRADELTLEECLRVADELGALGCQRATLTGGEPTLYPDWDVVGKRLAQHIPEVSLISNGWVWTARHAQQAKAAGLRGVAFSLDGLEKEHDCFRAEGSFRRVVDAVGHTLAAGLPVGINTTIHRLNSRQLPQLRQFLIDLGVRHWQLQFAIATGTMAENRDLVAPPEERLWLIPQIAELCRARDSRIAIYASDHVGYFGMPERDLRTGDTSMPFWLGCRAGCHVLGIESNGNVKGCLSLPSQVQGESRFVEGNLRQSSLRDIWNRKGGFAYNREFRVEQLGGFCAVCRFRDICRGGCTWTMYAESPTLATGNPHCFYHQAVKHGRHDLLDEEPTAEEKAYFG
ncbi:MAG: radical SAM protein [Polyangia bacterium]